MTVVNRELATRMIEQGSPHEVVIGTLALADLSWVTPVGGGLAIYDRAHEHARNIIDALGRRNMLQTADSGGTMPHRRKEPSVPDDLAIEYRSELPAQRPPAPRKTKYERLIDQILLDNRPGDWGLLNTFDNPTTAASLANDLRKRHPMLAFVGIRPADSEGSELWARIPVDET